MMSVFADVTQRFNAGLGHGITQQVTPPAYFKFSRYREELDREVRALLAWAIFDEINENTVDQ